MSDEAVYRTVPATPGLLNIWNRDLKKKKKKGKKKTFKATQVNRLSSVENSSNGLIFRKKTGEKRALFQLKSGRKTGEIRNFL